MKYATFRVCLNTSDPNLNPNSVMPYINLKFKKLKQCPPSQLICGHLWIDLVFKQTVTFTMHT